jgi:hypothetical protein
MQPEQVVKTNGKKMAMARAEEDEMLVDLSEQIDMKLYEWMSEHKMPALNLTAIILARLTWLAKQGNYKEDFVTLLEAPSQILKEEDDDKVVH